MPRYWVIRSKKEEASFFFEELQEGRLRQGWGWQDNQDLRLIAKKMLSGEELTPEQKSCWSGNRRLNPAEADSVKEGDYIVSPNLPSASQWCLSKVSGGYSYSIDPERVDFGHIRQIELLTRNSYIDPRNKYVSASLRRTMHSLSRMWNIDRLGADVQSLLDAIEAGKDISTPENSLQKLCDLDSALVDFAYEKLLEKYQGREFEDPVRRILERVYGSVEDTSGPKEHGADLICEQLDALGIPHRIAVQVKMWQGTMDDQHPLQQIKTAVASYESVSAGVIVTVAQSYTDTFQSALEAMQRELGIHIKVILREELCTLLLQYCSDIIGDRDSASNE